MIKPITAVARLGRTAWGAAAVLAAAGVLATGCGSASVAGSTGTGTSGSGTSAPASGGTATGGASGSAAPSASAAPVTTVSGGPVAAGEVACAGWRSDAPTSALPVNFVPVKVERCVNGVTNITGKGLWVTATLREADSGLAGLVSALRRSPGRPRPGTVCPALATVAPQIVLISADGYALIPRLPVTGCGLTQSQVLIALGTLPWRTVSVRLISPLSGGAPSPAVPVPTTTGQTATGTSPRQLQTVSAAKG